MLPPLQSEIERRFTGSGQPVLRISFAGIAGSGSEGDQHGDQMRAVVKQAVEEDQPCGLIIDLRHLDYQFGNWIGSWLHPRLRSCRTCLVAVGRTWECLRPLWEICRVDSIVPVFQSLAQAEVYVGLGEKEGRPAGPGAGQTGHATNAYARDDAPPA
jgi:hypothetical protein